MAGYTGKDALGRGILLFFELEMREKSETNLKITIYFFLFGKVDKLMFSAEIELVFCRERPACRSVNVGYV